jgi:hypothetical protein
MKNRFLMRRSLLAGALLVAGGGTLALVAQPAGASEKQLTTAGSFTTYQVMHNIFGASLNDLLPGGTTANQVIPATTELCKGGVNYSAMHKNATTVTVLTFPTGAPNGSSKGRDALLAEQPSTTATPTSPQHGKYILTKADCIDFARSSAPPTTSDVSTDFDYYSYALDGVGPMTGSHAGGSLAAPIALSLQTMINIYKCKPGYTTWKTVDGATAHVQGLTTQGGVTGHIVRFMPQAGSGTLSVYKTMMGFTPETVATATTTCKVTTGTPPVTSPTRPITVNKTVTISGHKKNVPVEENSEEGIIYYATAHHTPTIVKNAVYIYSAGKYEQEFNTTGVYNKHHENTVTQKTGATAIGNFTATNLLLAKMFSQSGTTHVTTSKQEYLVYGNPLSGTFTATSNRGTESINTTVVKEANEWFSHVPNAGAAKTSKASVPGVRYIWNVADTVLPSYSLTKMTVGFDNIVHGAKSALCNGDDASAITATGFVPLNSGSTAPSNTGGGYSHTGTSATFGGTSDLAVSYCREFPGKHLPTYGGTKHWSASTWVQET